MMLSENQPERNGFVTLSSDRPPSWAGELRPAGPVPSASITPVTSRQMAEDSGGAEKVCLRRENMAKRIRAVFMGRTARGGCRARGEGTKQPNNGKVNEPKALGTLNSRLRKFGVRTRNQSIQ